MSSVALLLALLVAPASLAEELPARAARLVEQGDDAFEDGDLSAAIKRYRRAYRVVDGGSIDVALRLVRAYYRAGRYEDAVETASEARRLDASPGEQAELAFVAGSSYYKSAYLDRSLEYPFHRDENWVRRMEMAKSFFALAARTSAETVPEALFFLGRVLELTRDPDQALPLYVDYLKREPGGRYADLARASLEYLQWERPPVFVEEGIVPPEKISAPGPQFPEEARLNRVTGTVIVLAVIDREGEMRALELVRDASYGLGAAAVEAIARWRFEPARTAQGEPIPVYYSFTVTFEPA